MSHRASGRPRPGPAPISAAVPPRSPVGPRRLRANPHHRPRSARPARSSLTWVSLAARDLVGRATPGGAPDGAVRILGACRLHTDTGRSDERLADELRFESFREI